MLKTKRRKRNNMLIDAVCFHNELDIFEFRLKYLWDVVDKFVVVEADRTHSGEFKPYNFDHYRFEWAKEKICYFPVTIDIFDLNLDYKPKKYEPDAPQWKIENRQRGKIIDACKWFSNHDILMISDCDEIPSLPSVQFRKDNKLKHPFCCDQRIVPYYLNYQRKDVGWRGTVMCDLGYARREGAQQLRDDRQRFSVMPDGGWHLSYFGGAQRIKRKIECMAHQEHNTAKNRDIERIEHCIKNGEGVIPDDGQPLIRVGEDAYPQEFLEYAPSEWWL